MAPSDCTYTIKLDDLASEHIRRLTAVFEALNKTGSVIVVPKGTKIEVLELDGVDCAAIGIDPPDEAA
jgi:hypothetical protein